MSKTRPRDFDSEGQYESAGVSRNLEVDLFEGEALARRIDADRVLVGGGLPDEAVELRPGLAAGRADFGPVDACVKHERGKTTVWLAP